MGTASTDQAAIDCRAMPIMLAGILAMIAGCQPSEKPAAPAVSTAEKTSPAGSATAKSEEVTLALNWHPEAEHGGYYAALVHGFYEEEGLKVTIRPGGPGVRVEADVASGAVTFGVANADKVIVWRAQQADVVAVMSPVQDSPRCIMVHKKSGLSKLQDLATRRPFTLAMNSDNPFALFLQKSVDLKDIQIVKYPGNVNQFIDALDYGIQAYSFSEPLLAQEKGADPVCLMVSDIGFNTYTSTLIAQREKIDKQPDLVARMTRASIRGWKKYLREPEATNKFIHEQNPEMGLKVLDFGVNALKPLCLPEGLDESRLGEMTSDRWEQLVKQMIEIGSIKPGAVSASESFTTQFLPVRQAPPEK